MVVIDEERATPRRPAVPARPTIRQSTALLALSVLCLIVTKGPLYWLRIEQAALGGDPIDDVWVQTVFVAIAALVLMLAAPAARTILADRVVTVLFSLLVLAVLASSLWSVDVPRTTQQSTMLLLGTAAALLAGAYLRRRHVLIALWTAMQAGVVISVFAWWREWPQVYDPRDRLAGIYYSSNSLGPVAVVAAASSLALAAIAPRRRSMIPVKVGLVAVAVVDLAVWEPSRSLTSLVAMLLSAGVVGLVWLAIPGRHVAARRTIAIGGAVVSAGLVVFAVVERERVLPRFDKASTFSGRTVLWDVILEFVGERPLQGWGFMAIWTQPEIADEILERDRFRLFEAHSGYMEVLIGAGVIALVLLLAVIATAVARTSQVMWRQPNAASASSLGLVVFAIAVNVGETFVGANLLPWALLCAATGGAVAARARLVAETDDRAEETWVDAGFDEDADGAVEDDDGWNVDGAPFNWHAVDEVIGVDVGAEIDAHRTR